MRKLLTIILLFASLTVGATKYYIATTGTDGAGVNGSLATPWLTLSYACTRATTAGDTIMVGTGTFTETSSSVLAVGVSIYGAGATSIITTAGALNPIISLTSATENTNGAQSISHIYIDGDSVAVVGIYVFVRGNVKVHDCTVRDFLSNGIIFDGRLAAGAGAPTIYPEGNEIYNCFVYDCGNEIYSDPYYYASPALSIGGQKGILIYDNIIDETGGKYGYGISTNTSGYNMGVQIYNNTILVSPKHLATNQWSFGIELWNSRGGMVIRDNYITAAIDFGGTSTDDSGGYGFSILIESNVIEMAALQPYDHTAVYLESDISGGVRITKNYIKNFNNSISLNTLSGPLDHMEDILIDNNVILETTKNTGNYSGRAIGHGTASSGSTYENVQIINNSIYTYSYKASAAVHFASAGVTYTNTLIQNNIFNNAYNAIRFENNTIVGLDITNNLFYGHTNATSYVGVTASDTVTLNNIGGDPLFRTTTDLHLKSTSPAIDAGLNVSTTTGGIDYSGNRIYGAAYDIGAYEWGQRKLKSNGRLVTSLGKLIIIKQ